MDKKDYPVRDGFIKKKKIGPDRLEEAKLGDKLKLRLALEKLKIILYFIMNIVLDFLKRYESQKPLYEKLLKVLKAIAEIAAKITPWK